MDWRSRILYIVIQQYNNDNNFNLPKNQIKMSLSPFSENSYFCYLYIQTTPQSYMGYAFIGIVILLAARAIYQFIKTHKRNLLNSTLHSLYLMTLLWAILQQAKLIGSQIIYWQLTQIQPTQQVFDKYQVYSKIMFVISNLSIFLIQTLIMLVPLNMSQNVIEIFQKLGGEYRKNIKFDIFCVWFFKVYLAIRSLFLFLIIPFLIVQNQYALKILVQIMLILFIISALFLLIFLILGLVATKNNKKLKQLVQQQQINKMLKQYIVLVICAALRFITQFVFAYMNYNYLAEQNQCYLNDTQSLAWRVANLIMQGPLTHYLPILVVLIIFNIQNKQVQDIQTIILQNRKTQQLALQQNNIQQKLNDSQNNTNHIYVSAKRNTL